MSSSVKPLEFRAGVWTSLIRDLRQRGHGRRESGAFLLGHASEGAKTVHEWLPYDELDPGSLSYDYVRLSTESFSQLWSVCAERDVQVVGDVHTHPFGPAQSPSDRANPMVSMAGHMALIVPRFAMGDVTPADVSVNVYLGSGKWSSHFGQQSATLIRLL
jgi:proteasome lid subunit RPN8/RPN11